MSETESPGGGGGARQPVPSKLMHDLRTPLSHIIGYTELLLEQAQREGQDGFLPQLHKVCAAGHHLLALIDENFYPAPAPDGGAGAESVGPEVRRHLGADDRET